MPIFFFLLIITIQFINLIIYIPRITDFSDIVQSVKNGNYVFFVGNAQRCELFNECFIDLSFYEHIKLKFQSPEGVIAALRLPLRSIERDFWSAGVQRPCLFKCMFGEVI